MRYVMIAAALTLGVSSVACRSQREAFRPMERATATAPTGYAAAEYPIRTRDGDLGIVKVWSQGAYREEVEGQNRTLVEVGIEVQQQTDHPIRLVRDTLLLDSASIDGDVVGGLRPVRLDRTGATPEGDLMRYRAVFLLPRGVRPGDVEAFRVRWQVRGDGIVFTQRTPFMQQPRSYYAAAPAYYYSPFYDPFLYPGGWPYGFWSARPYPFYHRPWVGWR